MDFDFGSMGSLFSQSPQFGDQIGQPQLEGVFGGTPRTPGANYMSGQAPEMVPWYGGQVYEMPTHNYLNDRPDIDWSKLAGIGASMVNRGGAAHGGGLGVGGGGGGNMKGLFSSLMRAPQLQTVRPTAGLLSAALSNWPHPGTPGQSNL